MKQPYYRRDHQRFHSCPGIVTLLLAEPRVNDVNNTINCDGGLGDVCGDDHFSRSGWRWLKDF